MALDKIVDSSELDSGLTTVANAIRTKGGTSAQLAFPNGMAQAIADLPSGGGLPNVHKFQVATDSTLGTYGGISFPVVSSGRANYFIMNPNSTHLNATDRYVRAIMCTVDYNTTVKALCAANRYDNATVLNQVASSLVNGVLTVQGSAVLHMEQTYTLDVYEVTWQ